MSFQDKQGYIHWKVHCSSPIEKVYKALTTDSGRASFWAESAREHNGSIEFHILNYPVFTGKILHQQQPYAFSIEYFGTTTHFSLSETADGGTDVQLVALVDDEEVRREMIAGWVSVLMAMKAAVDFGVDLRNHNAERTWDKGFVDN